jgi:hypothetical protein
MYGLQDSTVKPEFILEEVTVARNMFFTNISEKEPLVRLLFVGSATWY